MMRSKNNSQEIYSMKTAIKYLSVSAGLVLGFWFVFSNSSISKASFGNTTSPESGKTAQKQIETTGSPYKSFKKYAGKYSGTWKDIGQYRQGKVTAVFSPGKKRPVFTFNLKGISGLPFDGIQKIIGIYKGDKAIFKSKDPNLYGDTTVTVDTNGNISAVGTGLTFGVAFTGNGSIGPKKGVTFNYKITQGNFSFDAIRLNFICHTVEKQEFKMGIFDSPDHPVSYLSSVFCNFGSHCYPEYE
ncbi:MAG: hypothetical protein U0586_12360 [Candidatus Brocadiaceae bacterium]